MLRPNSDLSKVIELLKKISDRIEQLSKPSDVILDGDKVRYRGEIYYVVDSDFRLGHIVLGDRFLRPKINVTDVDSIEKVIH